MTLNEYLYPWHQHGWGFKLSDDGMTAKAEWLPCSACELERLRRLYDDKYLYLELIAIEPQQEKQA